MLVDVSADVALGDGLAIESTETGGSEQALQGGRVYSLRRTSGEKRDAVSAGTRVWIGFGRGEIDWAVIPVGALFVYKNDDPKLNRRLRKSFEVADAVTRQDVDFSVIAVTGRRLKLTANLGQLSASAESAPVLESATKHPVTREMLAEKLSRLGATAFRMRHLETRIEGGPMVPASLLNGLRREVVKELVQKLDVPPRRTIDVAGRCRKLLAAIDEPAPEQFGAAKLAVLCRTLDQVRVVAECGVDLDPRRFP